MNLYITVMLCNVVLISSSHINEVNASAAVKLWADKLSEQLRTFAEKEMGLSVLRHAYDAIGYEAPRTIDGNVEVSAMKLALGMLN